MSVMKIGMIGVLGVLLALQFKSEKTEYGLYIGVTICLLIFWFCMEQMVVFGKISVLLMGLPVLATVIENIGALSVG